MGLLVEVERHHLASPNRGGVTLVTEGSLLVRNLLGGQLNERPPFNSPLLRGIGL